MAKPGDDAADGPLGPGTDIGRSTGPSLTLDGLGNAVATWTRGQRHPGGGLRLLAAGLHRRQRPRDRHDRTARRSVRHDARHLVGARRGPAELELRRRQARLPARSVTHVYAAPGTYTVTVGASDAVGNASAPTTRQIVISNAPVPPPPPTPPTSVAKPKLKAAWKASHLVGTLTLSGTTGATHHADDRRSEARRQEDRVQEHLQGEERQVDAHVEAAGHARARQVRRDRDRERRQELADVVHARGAEVGHRRPCLRDRPAARARRDDARQHERAVGALRVRDAAEEGADDHDPVDPARTDGSSAPTRGRAPASSRRRSRTSAASPCRRASGTASSAPAATIVATLNVRLK